MIFVRFLYLVVVLISGISCMLGNNSGNQTEVVPENCPICNDTCLIGRNLDQDGCEICNDCITEGYLESDIIIDKKSYEYTKKRYFGEDEDQMEQRGLQNNDRGKWPRTGINVQIPYVFDSSVGSTKASNIRNAMQKYHTNTCIRFIKRTRETDYLHFVGRGGCSSYVGRVGGRQTITIGNGCDRQEGTIIHEIMHALGFYHEQSRGDRDDHITILWNNIRNGARVNFQKQTDWDPLGSPYDIGSVMHYGGFYFARGNNPTIVDKSNNPVVAQRRGFSAEDINQINTRYQCAGYSAAKEEEEFSTTVAITNRPTITASTTILPEQCFDSHTSCEIWKRNGHCQTSAGVRERCVKTCTGCQTETSNTLNPSTITVTTTTNNCFDGSISSCEIWKQRGYCDNPTYSSSVREYCPVSCGICRKSATTEAPTTTTANTETNNRPYNSCQDRSAVTTCQDWKRRGYCQQPRFRESIKRLCPRTCGFCSEPLSTTPRITTTTNPQTACNDRNPRTCSSLANQCTSSDSVRRYCSKTCTEQGITGLCVLTSTTAQITNTNQCRDLQTECANWSIQGYCTRSEFASAMASACPLSCGRC